MTGLIGAAATDTLEKLKAAIDRDPERSRSSPAFVPVWTRLGALDHRQGHDDQAIADLEQATKIAPLSPLSAGAFETLGFVRLERHELDPAIRALTSAIELAPRRGLPWDYRARARLEKGELAPALDDLGKLIELEAFLFKRKADGTERRDREEWRRRLEGVLARTPATDPGAARVRAFLERLAGL